MLNLVVTNDFYSSFKKGEADANESKLTSKLGKGNDESGDGKSEMQWSGTFIGLAGEMVRFSVWDWKGSMRRGFVSIWCDGNSEDLLMLRNFLEA